MKLLSLMGSNKIKLRQLFRTDADKPWRVPKDNTLQHSPALCNDLKLTTQYRPHRVLDLLTTSRQSLQAPWAHLRNCSIPLSPLRSAMFTKSVMPVPPHTTSSVCTALANAFITATFFTVHEVCDGRYATWCIFDIFKLALTRFPVSLSPSVK